MRQKIIIAIDGYSSCGKSTLAKQLAKHLHYIHVDSGAIVFHAGTKKQGDEIVTNGGRVLAVSAIADGLGDAIELSKEILNQIHFEDMYYRRDIGYEFID